MPTFRDNGAQFIDFDWEELDKEIGKMGAKLFYKKHPDDRRRYAADFANIIQLPSSAEVNSLLLGADALVSDYSSVIFDYMFLNRPIVYYIPDYKEFESGCRAFNFHPQEVAVGPICASFGELLNALGQIAAGAANIASGNRDAVMERLHTYCDAQSNDRVLALIEQQFFADSLRRNDDVSPAQTAGALENVRM